MLGFVLADEVYSFLFALGVGALLAAVYDCFRAVRIAICLPSVVVFFLDLLFSFFVFITTFFLLLERAYGKIRIMLLLGELLGFIIYRLTIGAVVIRLWRMLVHLVRKIFRVIFTPVFRLLALLLSWLWRPFRYLLQKFKKLFIKLNFNLKQKASLLYNNCVSRFPKPKRMLLWQLQRKEKGKKA